MNGTENRIALMKPAFSRFMLLAVALMLIASLAVTPAQAQAVTQIFNLIQPTDLLVFVPCALGGAGELVELSGPLHVQFVTTIDDQGGYHSMFKNQPQGISGYGLTSGDKYQGTGETAGTFDGRLGFQSSFVNNFKIIGAGPGNNFLVHETFHITIKTNGELAVFVDNLNITCQ